MAQTTCDFFLFIAGSNHGEQVNFVDGATVASFKPYYSAIGAQSANRKLAVCQSCPSFLNSDSTNSVGMRDRILTAITNYAAAQQAQVGQLALLGSSNGAGISLAVAYSYQRQFNRPLAYIRLLDLPMFSGGRSTPISDDVGNLDPINDPLPPQTDPDNAGIDVLGGLQLLTARSRYGMLDPRPGDVPILRLKPLNARVKWNTYQIEGNHAKLRAFGFFSWMWVSGAKVGDGHTNEVHGKIEDSSWRDNLLTVATAQDGPNLFGALDDNFHNRACATKESYYTEAATELAR